MSSERALWEGLRREMRGAWVAHKHVDAAAGVPDVSFVLPAHVEITAERRAVLPPLCGWLELKERTLPAKSDTRFDVGLRPEQRLWFQKRGQLGENCYVLVRIDAWHVLLRWDLALETFTTSELESSLRARQLGTRLRREAVCHALRELRQDQPRGDR